MELLFSDGEISFMNINFLQKQYDEGNLKDAHIFAELFKLKNTPYSFNTEKMKVNENNQITICSFLNITFLNWNYLMNFLKSGSIEEERIEELMQISNKFGGIPSIDSFYSNYVEHNKNKIKYEEKKEQMIIDNPLNPKDDLKQKFTWSTSLISEKDYISEGYEAAEPISQYYIYIRKRKSN